MTTTLAPPPRLPDGLPTPTWCDEEYGVALYRADCLDVLAALPDGCVGACVTDPPYGIAHSCNYDDLWHGVKGKHAARNNYPKIIGDDKPFDPSPFLSLAPCLFFGANYFADKLPPSSGWLVWDKQKPDTMTQSTCELAWTNFIKGVRRIVYLWNGMARDGEQQQFYHATQKPVAVMEWALSFPWTPPGLVFDPYMGSCPTGVACVNLGRAFIGCELESKYFDIAVARISQAIIDKQDGPLFATHDPAQMEIGGDTPCHSA